MYRIITELEDHFDNDATSELEDRLGGYVNKAQILLIEENYIDRDWRDEYSLFYSKTFYKDVRKFTTRVHLIKEEIQNVSEISSDNYLGYFVVRPLHIRDVTLLKVILKPLKEPLGVRRREDLYVATCEYSAHIAGSSKTIETFPFYHQDSVTDVCAHADMWMLTEYMHRKFHMSKPSIRDFILSTPPFYGRVIPSRGLTIEQICTILNSLGYNVSIESFDRDVPKILERIDTYLESNLPTILAYDEHVVVIAGHTLDGSKKDYLVYDDSGYHLANLLELEEGETPQFAARVDKRRLLEKLERSEKPVFAINVEFDKHFYPLASVNEFVKLFIEEEGIEITRKRILLADSNDFKKFCKDKIGVSKFDDIPLPHYLWIVELYHGDDLICELILDASAHKNDYSEKVNIATWYEDRIYRDRKIERVGRAPEPFSNLTFVDA